MYIVHWRPVNSGTAQATSDVGTRCRGNAAIVNRDLLPALVLPTAAYYDWKLYDRVAHQSSGGRPCAIQAGGSCFRRHFCLLLSIQWRCSPPVGRSSDATLSVVVQQLCNSCATVVVELFCNSCCGTVVVQQLLWNSCCATTEICLIQSHESTFSAVISATE